MVKNHTIKLQAHTDKRSEQILLQEHTHMAIKGMETSPSEIKATKLVYRHSLVLWTGQTITSAGKEKLKPLHSAGGAVKWYSYLVVSSLVKHWGVTSTSNSTQEIPTRGQTWAQTEAQHPNVLTSVLTAKRWKRLKRSSANEWINKMWCMDTRVLLAHKQHGTGMSQQGQILTTQHYWQMPIVETRCPEQTSYGQMGNRSVVSQCWRLVRDGEGWGQQLKGTVVFSFGVMKMFSNWLWW